ncbi:MAG TPA: hypothetical protein VF214_02275, partial [Edaphobacter sp.]
LAQLEPMFNQMAEQLEQGIQRVRFSPEMQQMISRVQGFATDPEFQKQLDQARHQVQAAAETMRKELSLPSCQHKMD